MMTSARQLPFQHRFTRYERIGFVDDVRCLLTGGRYQGVTDDHGNHVSVDLGSTAISFGCHCDDQEEI